MLGGDKLRGLTNMKARYIHLNLYIYIQTCIHTYVFITYTYLKYLRILIYTHINIIQNFKHVRA